MNKAERERRQRLERGRRYRAEHVEERAVYARRYREEHAEEIAAYRKRWREANLDHARESNREYMRRRAAEERKTAERRLRKAAYSRARYHADVEASRAKVREYLAGRRAADPEGFREGKKRRNDAWRARNREEVNRRQREKKRLDPRTNARRAQAYYAGHAEERREYSRRYREEHREQDRERSRQWRARERRRKEAGLPVRRVHRIGAEEVRDYVAQLGERAERVANRAVQPSEDNMLNISTDGRKAALDIRMVDPTANPAIVPLDEIADRIARIHHAHAGNTYLDSRTGQPSPLPGALQIVFCDLGTPNPTKWNAYDYLKVGLTARGVPEGGVRFVHEARNDAEKARLFAACRDGKVSILIASTSKAGVGTNVQARAIALHDVDCPWRPADVAQRHGRILRQGNQNAEVEVIQYVTEHTFAAYMWQAIERKSKFIGQVMRGRLDVREIDDLGSNSLSAAEAKALASGNPLLLERSVALNEATRLERLERAYHRAQNTLRFAIDSSNRTLDRLRAEQAALEAALGKVEDLSGDRFRITIGRGQYTSRTDAATAIAQWALGRSLQYARPMRDDRGHGPLGQISGFPIIARTRTDLGKILLELNLEGVPGSAAISPIEKVLDDALGLIRQLEHRAVNIPDLIAKTQERITTTLESRADAERNLGSPFKHRDALDTARAELARVDAALADLAPDSSTAPAAPTPNAAAPVRQSAVPDYSTPSHSSHDAGASLA